MDIYEIKKEIETNGGAIPILPASFESSGIIAGGKNNTIYFNPNTVIRNTEIIIEGDNNLLFFGDNKFSLSIRVGNDSIVYIGDNGYFHPINKMRITVGDRGFVLIGNQTLSSMGVAINAEDDQVLIIGDHCWLSHGASVRGNSRLSNNTILAANSVIDCIQTERNSCYASYNRQIMADVIYSETSLRKMGRAERLFRSEISEKELSGIINIKGIKFDGIVEELRNRKTSAERCEVLTREKDNSNYVKAKAVMMSQKEKAKKSCKMDYSDNEIVGDISGVSDNTTIIFNGIGNRLVCDRGVLLEDSKIVFNGDNSILYLSKSKKPYRMIISNHHDTTAVFGKNNKFPTSGRRPNFNVSEGECLIVGDNNTIGADTWIRTSDQHAIYSIKDRKRPAMKSQE